MTAFNQGPDLFMKEFGMLLNFVASRWGNKANKYLRCPSQVKCASTFLILGLAVGFWITNLWPRPRSSAAPVGGSKKVQ
eukprot:15350131-Ditylum_brightwellii.AAC.1